jgi:uncharacterized protein (TIGR02391 family)
MGRPRILDQKLMDKIAKKIGKKDITVVNGIVSKKASKLGISSEAALVLLAREHGIGTSTYQRRLDSTKQAEVRDSLPTLFVEGRSATAAVKSSNVGRVKPTINKRASLKFAIEYLIQDQELRERCQDILLASANFDRPVNQATLVLEDRIRKKSQPPGRLTGENLVGYAFNEDMSKTVLRVASNDTDDQRGFTQMLRGIVPAFRNKTHHHIIDSFSREEAMRVCGFIDVLLRIVDNSTKVKP